MSKKTKKNSTNVKCYICGIDLVDGTGKTRKANNFITKDHVFPRCYGGKITLPCCLKCNKLKKNHIVDVSVFLYVLWKGNLYS